MHFTKEEKDFVMRTLRKDRGIKKAVVPLFVEKYARKHESILDFGGGKGFHARKLNQINFKVYSYDFYHNFKFLLDQKYDIVYASNVLNVQMTYQMLHKTLKQIYSVCNNRGVFIFNYPSSPRKLKLTTKELLDQISYYFLVVERHPKNIFVCQPLKNNSKKI